MIPTGRRNPRLPVGAINVKHCSPSLDGGCLASRGIMPGDGRDECLHGRDPLRQTIEHIVDP
jgi:hypothetical protein